MHYLKEVKLVVMADGSIVLIPVEQIKDCQIIRTDEKTGLWVYRLYAGINCMADEEHIANPPTQSEIATILSQNGKCFVAVDSEGRLSMPSSPLGYKKVVIHLTRKEEAKRRIEELTSNFFRGRHARLNIHGYRAIVKEIALC